MTAREYIGLVTRGIAFAVDAAVINGVAILVAAVVALILSVVGLPDELDKWIAAAGAAAFVVWSVLYFVVFWSTTGQTPGNRLMRIRVCRADDGEVLPPRRAVVRFAGLVLSVLFLFTGFLPALFNDRRRGAHDMLARSVVVGVEPAATPPRPDTHARSGAVAPPRPGPAPR